MYFFPRFPARLRSEIDVDNCFEFSDIAELYQLTSVQEHVENFILKNFERVSENDQVGAGG